MVEFKWIKTSSFLGVVLTLTLFTAGLDCTSEQYSPRIGVGEGDEVTLPCKTVIHGQKCDRISWLFSNSLNTAAVQLIEHGQIGEHARAKADRLSVAENCSLVVKNVSAEDAGLYSCRGSRHQDAKVFLFLITMTEQKDTDTVTLSCSVMIHRGCEHTVKWLYEDADVDEDIKDRETQRVCSVTITFPTWHVTQNPEYRELFKCEVTDHYTESVQHFTFPPQSSGVTPGKDATTAATTLRRGITENSNKTRMGSTGSAINDWWLYIIVAIGLVALLIIIVMVIRWKKTKGKKTQMDENAEQSLTLALTESAPESSRDTADPVDRVSYASISYTKTTSKARVQVKKDDDEGELVTYSALKTSLSSAGASDDPSTLYATVNKSGK